jgi:hypothetical protein
MIWTLGRSRPLSRLVRRVAVPLDLAPAAIPECLWWVERFRGRDYLRVIAHPTRMRLQATAPSAVIWEWVSEEIEFLSEPGSKSTGRLRSNLRTQPGARFAAWVDVAPELMAELNRTRGGALRHRQDVAEFWPLAGPEESGVEDTGVEALLHPAKGTRNHQALLLGLAEELRRLGWAVTHNHEVDARVSRRSRQVIFEVKTAEATASAQQLRLAVGQLLHYEYLFGPCARRTLLALVVRDSEVIRAEDRRFLESLGISLVCCTSRGWIGLTDVLRWLEGESRVVRAVSAPTPAAWQGDEARVERHGSRSRDTQRALAQWFEEKE